MIVYPGIHPTGKQYGWVYPDWRLVDVPEFDPEWLPAPKTVERCVANVSGDRRQLIKRALAYGSRVKCIEHHSAHNNFFRFCCWMVDELNLTREEMWVVVNQWQQTNCFREDGTTPYPWGNREVEHKLDSAISR